MTKKLEEEIYDSVSSKLHYHRFGSVICPSLTLPLLCLWSWENHSTIFIPLVHFQKQKRTTKQYQNLKLKMNSGLGSSCKSAAKYQSNSLRVVHLISSQLLSTPLSHALSSLLKQLHITMRFHLCSQEFESVALSNQPQYSNPLFLIKCSVKNES